MKLSVIDLSKVELATEEDRLYGIDYWTRLFKAKTWEEIKMLAEKEIVDLKKQMNQLLEKLNANE